ncbi:MAG: ABC transporter permease subunit [Nannocystaceae bacterium]
MTPAARRSPIEPWLRAALVLAAMLATATLLLGVVDALAEAAPDRAAIALAATSLARTGAIVLATAVVATVVAWPLARAVPSSLLLGWALVGAPARSLGVLDLGLAPGALAIAYAAILGGAPWIALVVQLRREALPRGVLEAAQDLGASPLRAWWTVELPLCRGALGFGLMWCALQQLADATTWELAGGGKLYSTALLLRDAALEDDAPALVSAVLLGLLATSVPLSWWIAAMLRRVAMDPTAAPRAHWHGPARGVAIALAILVALPLAALVPAALHPLGPLDARLAARLQPTFSVIAGTVALGVPLGAAAAIANERWPRLSPVVLLPLVIPPGAYAAATLFAAHGLGWPPGPGLMIAASTPTAIALAFVVTTLALPRVAPTLREAAADLGAGAWARLRWLWWPRLAPAWAGAAVLVAAWCLNDTAVAPYLAGPGDSTLAIATTTAFRGLDAATATRWALLQAATAILAALALPRLRAARRPA